MLKAGLVSCHDLAVESLLQELVQNILEAAPPMAASLGRALNNNTNQIGQHLCRWQWSQGLGVAEPPKYVMNILIINNEAWHLPGKA